MKNRTPPSTLTDVVLAERGRGEVVGSVVGSVVGRSGGFPISFSPGSLSVTRAKNRDWIYALCLISVKKHACSGPRCFVMGVV